MDHLELQGHFSGNDVMCTKWDSYKVGRYQINYLKTFFWGKEAEHTLLCSKAMESAENQLQVVKGSLATPSLNAFLPALLRFMVLYSILVNP